MQSINKTLEYHELLMTLDNIESIELNFKLPEGFEYVFYSDEKDKIEWAKIHISSENLLLIRELLITLIFFIRSLKMN